MSAAHLAEEREKLKKNAKFIHFFEIALLFGSHQFLTPRKFEDLAVGVLAKCHRADGSMTQAMLHESSELFNNRDSIAVMLYIHIFVKFF
jgi:hypothetical protein